jgi:hypothetical protein
MSKLSKKGRREGMVEGRKKRGMEEGCT